MIRQIVFSLYSYWKVLVFLRRRLELARLRRPSKTAPEEQIDVWGIKNVLDCLCVVFSL